MTRVAEYRVEMICAEAECAAVTAALRAAHPYEEPAFDFCEALAKGPDEGNGMTIREHLDEAVCLAPEARPR